MGLGITSLIQLLICERENFSLLIRRKRVENNKSVLNSLRTVAKIHLFIKIVLLQFNVTANVSYVF